MEISRKVIASDGDKVVIRIESIRHKNAVSYKIKKHTTEVKWWLGIGSKKNVFSTKREAMMRFDSGKMGKSNIPMRRWKPSINLSSYPNIGK